jgi:hypothetical protein
VFTVWDRLDANPLAQITGETVATMFPDDPPHFLARIPFSYNDKGHIERELRDAGFTSIKIEDLHLESHVASALEPAVGQTQGTPLRAEIEARDPSRLLEATQATAAALRRRFGDGPFQAPLQALLVTASR